MTKKRYGPGVRLLAELAGRSPDEVRSDPKALAEGLKALGDKATEIIQARASDDPKAQARAENEWASMKVHLADGPSPADVFRERLRGVLTDVREALEQDTPGSGEADGAPPAQDPD